MMAVTILLRLFCFFQISLLGWSQANIEFECGKNDESPYSILTDDKVGTWPWMASLGYFENEEWTHQCGTTLINQNYFLTAAHCAIEIILPEWQILAGIDDLKVAKSRNKKVKILDIEDKIVHPQFIGNAYFDVALLRTQRVDFTDRLSPICLPDLPNNNQDLYKSDLMYVTGWGAVSDTTVSSKALKRATVQAFSQSHCNTTHHAGRQLPDLKAKVEKSVPNLFQSQIMCAGQFGLVAGSCKGDSGGPLFFPNPEVNSYFQIGIVHGAIAECGSKRFPGIYVRLDDPDILEFIQMNTKDTSPITLSANSTEIRITSPSTENKDEFLDSSSVTLSTKFPEIQKEDHPTGKKVISKVLVALGTIDASDYLSDVEIIDLLSSKTTCQKPENFPYKTVRALGGLGFLDKPLICGGEYNKSACHLYEDGTWKSSGSLKQGRFGFAMTKSPFQDGSSKLFLTGGRNESNKDLSSSEVLTENGWQVSVPLPVTISQHCMVTVNLTSVMVIGGLQNYELSGRSFLFNSETNIWTEGPTLNTPRFYHSCGSIRKNSQTEDKSLIAVGGHDGSSRLSSVKVLDLDSNAWRRGPDLPFGINEAALVEDPSGGVVLIGGYNVVMGSLDTLYRLPHAGSDATWELMPQKLKTKIYRHTAFLIPDEIAACN